MSVPSGGHTCGPNYGKNCYCMVTRMHVCMQKACMSIYAVCICIYAYMFNNAAILRLYSNLIVNDATCRFNQKLKFRDQC